MGKEEKPDNLKGQANTESRNAEDIERAIDALAHVLQRHLLMFAYTTYAYRFNPAVRKSPYDEPVEYIHAPEVPNYDGDDDDGEFLLESVNQRILLGHIQKAHSEFGRGKGKRPTTQTVDYDEEKDRLTVTHKDIERGTLPAWHVCDWATYYLERSTKGIIDTVCSLRKVDARDGFNEIADLAVEVARPAGHPTWEFRSTHRPEENIPWEYPQQVLEATSRVRDAKSQVFKQYPNRAKVRKGKQPENRTNHEQELTPWTNPGDACFIIEDNRIKFHLDGDIKDLRLKNDSRTHKLLFSFSAKNPLSGTQMQDICKGTTRPSDIVKYANKSLNKKLSALNLDGVPPNTLFIKYHIQTKEYGLSPKIIHKSDLERKELEQPLIDDRGFKDLDEAEESY